METKKKVILMAFVVVVVAVLLIFLSGYITKTTGFSTNEFESEKLARELTAKGVIMYGLDTCPHCQEQKKEFGAAFKYINYTACEKDLIDCSKLNGVPAWKLGDKILYGTQSFEKLREFAGIKEA